jgi:transposase
MLYLGIDLHAKQLTVNVRDEIGQVLIRRQVSTRGDEPRRFLEEVARHAGESGYVAILEVCGFHDWLTELLPICGCREVVLVQAEDCGRRKTDKRDASKLSEILWVNRQRLLAGLKVQGVRRITPPTPAERHDRRLTQLRRNAGAERTRIMNSVRHILLRLNVAQHCPTKGIDTARARRWLQTITLPALDRFEMDGLLKRWKTVDDELQEMELHIAARAAKNRPARLLKTTPGAGWYMALAFASRIGKIDRFPTPRSLPNYFGITPSCRNSGESDQRLGSITKQGSTLVRFLLGQLVLHVLRKDPAMRAWYQRIKKRRGSKIARVAVMRRLTVIFWHMLKHNQSYMVAAAPKDKPSPRRSKASPAVKTVAATATLGALPPDPRDLSLSARCEEGQETARRRKKTSGRSQPSALRIKPGAGARGASQQSPILPSG